jgi:Cu+-exporting ATPase
MVNQDRTESAQEQSGSESTEPLELSADLVCGLLVGPGRTTERVRHEGQDYYFCSPSCAGEFRSDPPTYIKPAKDEVCSAFAMLDSDDDNDESYTCPRHPEVELPSPGACPKCGMAAEPHTFALEDE